MTRLVPDGDACPSANRAQDYAAVAADLRRLGIRGRCLINGAQRIPIAFYAHCASTPAPIRVEPSLATSANPGGTWRFALLEWPRFPATRLRAPLAAVQSGMPDI
jgi:hypothetical protein